MTTRAHTLAGTSTVAAAPGSADADDRPPGAAAEWRAHWPLVVAAMGGLSFASVAASSIGLFMEPLSREFGWSRAAIASGLTVFASIAVPLAPVAGALIDRLGSRRMAIPGLIVSATLLAAFSLASGTVLNWLLLWALYALAAVSIKAPVWTTAVTSMFSSGRGLALGATLCGTAVAQTLSPIVTQWLISTQGWRAAYVWLALGWGTVALLLVLLFFFDVRDRQRLKPAASASGPAKAGAAAPLPGLSLREARRSAPLLKIAAAALISNCVVGGILVHQVPLLREHGFTAALAAAVAGSAGIASLCGKLFSGWLLDRVHGGRIASITLALPALSFLMLLNNQDTPLIAMAAIMITGYVTGAQLQLTTYLTGRYGGLRNFGSLIGVLSGLIALGIGIGPVLVGAVYDHLGSYAPMLKCGIPAALFCSLLLARLGPYPDWTAAEARDGVRGRAG
ncbi:MAG: MFS transporter [Solimonas sp.]